MPKHNIPGNKKPKHDDIITELQADVGNDKPMRVIMEHGKVVEIDIENVTDGQLNAAVNKAKGKFPGAF